MPLALQLAYIRHGVSPHQAFVEILAVSGIVCVSHAVIAFLARVTTPASRRQKLKNSGPDLFWLRGVQFVFGGVCVYLVVRLSTSSERFNIYLWVVLLALTPVFAMIRAHFGRKKDKTGG